MKRTVSIPAMVAAALLFFVSGLLAAPPSTEIVGSFQEANAAYDQQAYKEAREGYMTLVEQGNRSANLFFNLGNADYRLGEKGAALLNYERALALEPGHPEARANLDFVRRELQPQRWEQPLWERVLEWPETVTRYHAAWVGALFFWALAICVAPLFWRRKAFVPGAVVCGAVALWCAGAVYSVASNPGLWIVTEKGAPVRSAPVDTAKASRKLSAGSEVRVLLERGAWLYVALPKGGSGEGSERGWMLRSALGPVSFERGASSAIVAAQAAQATE